MQSMKKQVIELMPEGFQYNNINIKWDDIYSMRRYDNKIFKQLATRIPSAEIYLKGGDIVKLNVNLRLKLKPDKANQCNDIAVDGKMDYQVVIEYIESHLSIKQIKIKWVEWRLFIPSAVVQAILLTFLIMLKSPVDQIVIDMIVASIFALPLGWIWEKSARKKMWK